MAKQAITSTPTALAGITTGVAYTIQFRSSGKTYIETSSTAPTDASGAFVVGTNGVVTAKRTGAEQVYVWADATGGTAVYDEAV